MPLHVDALGDGHQVLIVHLLKQCPCMSTRWACTPAVFLSLVLVGRVPRGCVGVFEAFERAVRQEDGDDADDRGEEVVLERERAVVVAEHAGGVAGARGDDVGASHHCGGVGFGVWVAAWREEDGGVAVDAGVADDRGCGAVVGGGGDGLHVDLKGLERPKRADCVVAALGPERGARRREHGEHGSERHPFPRPGDAEIAFGAWGVCGVLGTRCPLARCRFTACFRGLVRGGSWRWSATCRSGQGCRGGPCGLRRAPCRFRRRSWPGCA